MGYHIILNQDQEELEQNIEDLANFEIRPITIIYEGDEQRTPFMIKNNERI